MSEMKSSAPEIIKTLRKRLGYTQEDVAAWINVSKSNYSRKEKVKNGVAMTADEFLTILSEFKKRGPKQSRHLGLEDIIDDLIKR